MTCEAVTHAMRNDGFQFVNRVRDIEYRVDAHEEIDGIGLRTEFHEGTPPIYLNVSEGVSGGIIS